MEKDQAWHEKMTNKHRCKKLTKLLGAVEDGWVSWGAPSEVRQETPQSTGGEYGASLGSTIRQSQWQLGIRNSMKSWHSVGNSIRNTSFGYRSSTSGTSGENVVGVGCSLRMGLVQRKRGEVWWRGQERVKGIMKFQMMWLLLSQACAGPRE